jgi:hypothetical protein
LSTSKPPDDPRALHRKRRENPEARCPHHPKKELRPFVKQAWDAGWWCERRRKYIFCFPPDGTTGFVKVPMSPSGPRTIYNVKQNFAAAGLPL